MGVFKRLPIFATCCLIVLLASAEGWLAWRYFNSATLTASETRARNIATLQRELKVRQDEVNHLIFLRESERRHGQLLAANGTQATAVDDSEAELAAATAQALEQPLLKQGRRGTQQAAAARSVFDGLPRAVLPAPVPGMMPLEDEDSDVLAASQGAAPALTPADIDPKHLVNMANIMTGHAVAELTRMKGHALIRYKNMHPGEDDPVWHLLDAIGQANALEGITLVADDRKDQPKLERLLNTLASSGVPSRLIHIRTGDPEYRGLDGILISLAKKEVKNP